MTIREVTNVGDSIVTTRSHAPPRDGVRCAVDIVVRSRR